MQMHKITVFLMGILFGFSGSEASEEYQQKLYDQHDLFQYCKNEMQKEAEAIQNIKKDVKKCDKNEKMQQYVYKLQQYCENLALHPIDPYQSILLNYYVSDLNVWHVRLHSARDFPNAPSFPELLSEVNQYMKTCNIDYKATMGDLPFLLSKAVLAASAGRLWNVRPLFEIEKKHTLNGNTDCLLRSVVASDREIGSNNLYRTIYQLFAYLNAKWEYSCLDMKSFSKGAYGTRYAYNQMLGFNIQNAGNAVVLRILREQKEKDIKFPLNELQNQAAIWMDLLSGNQSIADLDPDIRPLFASFKSGEDGRFEPVFNDLGGGTTILENEFSKIDPAMALNDPAKLGGKTVNSLYENSDFAIAGFVPLLARGLVTEPRTELGIMLKNTNWMDDKTLYTSNEVSDLLQVCRLAQSHFGYNLVGHNFVKRDNAFEFVKTEGVTADFHPFLPIYHVLGVIEDDHQYYEYFPQTCVEQYIKAEAKARIDGGINAAVKKILYKRNPFLFWELKKGLLRSLLELQETRKDTEDLVDFKNQMMEKYHAASFESCLDAMSEEEQMNYKRMLADQTMNQAMERQIKKRVFAEASKLEKHPVFQANENNAFCFKTSAYRDENFIYRP